MTTETEKKSENNDYNDISIIKYLVGLFIGIILFINVYHLWKLLDLSRLYEKANNDYNAEIMELIWYQDNFHGKEYQKMIPFQSRELIKQFIIHHKKLKVKDRINMENMNEHNFIGSKKGFEGQFIEEEIELFRSSQFRKIVEKEYQLKLDEIQLLLNDYQGKISNQKLDFSKKMDSDKINILLLAMKTKLEGIVIYNEFIQSFKGTYEFNSNATTQLVFKSTIIDFKKVKKLQMDPQISNVIYCQESDRFFIYEQRFNELSVITTDKNSVYIEDSIIIGVKNRVDKIRNMKLYRTFTANNKLKTRELNERLQKEQFKHSIWIKPSILIQTSKNTIEWIQYKSSASKFTQKGLMTKLDENLEISDFGCLSIHLVLVITFDGNLGLYRGTVDTVKGSYKSSLVFELKLKQRRRDEEREQFTNIAVHPSINGAFIISKLKITGFYQIYFVEVNNIDQIYIKANALMRNMHGRVNEKIDVNVFLVPGYSFFPAIFIQEMSRSKMFWRMTVYDHNEGFTDIMSAQLENEAGSEESKKPIKYSVSIIEDRCYQISSLGKLNFINLK